MSSSLERKEDEKKQGSTALPQPVQRRAEDVPLPLDEHDLCILSSSTAFLYSHPPPFPMIAQPLPFVRLETPLQHEIEKLTHETHDVQSSKHEALKQERKPSARMDQAQSRVVLLDINDAQHKLEQVKIDDSCKPEAKDENETRKELLHKIKVKSEEASNALNRLKQSIGHESSELIEHAKKSVAEWEKEMLDLIKRAKESVPETQLASLDKIEETKARFSELNDTITSFVEKKAAEAEARFHGHHIESFPSAPSRSPVTHPPSPSPSLSIEKKKTEKPVGETGAEILSLMAQEEVAEREERSYLQSPRATATKSEASTPATRPADGKETSRIFTTFSSLKDRALHLMTGAVEQSKMMIKELLGSHQSGTQVTSHEPERSELGEMSMRPLAIPNDGQPHRLKEVRTVYEREVGLNEKGEMIFEVTEVLEHGLDGSPLQTVCIKKSTRAEAIKLSP